MSKFYKDNGIKLGPLQGSVTGVPVPQGPGFSITEDQAPDSDFSHRCKRKGVSKDIVSVLTMLVEDLDDEIMNGMKAEEEVRLECERQMAAASHSRD